ncbi:flagellar basal body-associated protein FliL [Chungangia koreensis]|uniref:Flagellar protein FliL n=1 Tax=Chungangia koreensis TaxID=752657 RepID=A0ABV8X2D0_9LACT
MKNKMLTIMLIILTSITLVGVVALIFVFQFNNGAKAEQGPTIDEIIEASVDVPEITTNLEGKNVIRLSLKIQTDGKDAAEELTKRDFQVKNIVIQELSEMTAAELEGKEGKQSFENAIKAQVDELMDSGEVQKVYITSYIIQ